MEINKQIDYLLEYKNMSKAELARLLNITPQNLQKKLNTKNLNLQFLTKVCEITDCNLQVYFQDNKYKQNLITSTDQLYTKIKSLTKQQQKLILDLINQLKG